MTENHIENKKKRRVFNKYFFITVIITLAIIWSAPFVWRGLVQPPSNLGESRRSDFFTFLIFGYDIYLNTDTIMVAAYDVAAQRAYIISIARDMRVNINGDARRINYLYPEEVLYGSGHAAGVELLKQGVQSIIGFRPDFYVGLNEEVFATLVDVVGGVYIDVPFRMHYHDPYQDLYIDLQEGRQRLNGTNALHFVKFRYHYDRTAAITTHQRIEHQHQFLSAIMQELSVITPMMIVRSPRLAVAYFRHINTDINMRHLFWFGEQFMHGNIEIVTHNYPVTGVRPPPWYEVPNARDALTIINRTINPFTHNITMDMLQLVL